ncbi:hypothetical protein [Psychromarinibacter sp. S121]|uniref:hypothetical protein n=1 Tax=Psychromarinibacter sp. S121 TaxID=3415127 RepID=UPI003C7B0E83
MDQEQLKLLLEAERRGILPPEKRAALDEARRRGLVPAGNGTPAKALPPSEGQMPERMAGPTDDPTLNALIALRAEEGKRVELSPAAVALLEELTAEKPGSGTTGAEQFGSGLNEGLASFAGMPVDLVTSGINKGVAGLNNVTGWDIPQIENPVGGSQSIGELLSPFTTEEEPTGSGQRYARRIGQEIGFGAPAALTMASLPGVGAMARGSFPGYMAASTASDVGAGAAGQTAAELFPDSPMADYLATLAGGVGTAAGLNLATRRKPPVPTLDELKATVDAKYLPIEQSGAKLTPEAWQRINKELTDYLTEKGIDPNKNIDVDTFGPVIREATRGTELSGGGIWDIEKWRRLIQENVANNPKLQKHGNALKGRIDRFLSGLSERDLIGGDPTLLDNLSDARRLAHQKAKAETILDAANRGNTRAATSGTGGNQVNSVRQNVRPIFDRETSLRPGKRSGFTPDELAAMEKVVKGTPVSNTLRNIGKLSPTSSTMGALLTGGGVMGGVFSPGAGNLYAVPAAMGMAGLAAKPFAERAAGGHVRQLVDILLNGGGKPEMRSAEGTLAAIAAELMKASTGRGELTGP